jgi:hypothetical protein
MNKWTSLALPIVGGGCIAFFVSGVLFAVSKVWMALVIVALAGLATTFVVKDVQKLLFAVFIVTLPLGIKKVLIKDRTFHKEIVEFWGYPPGAHPLPQVFLSDLVFILILLIWVYHLLMKYQKIEIPTAFWFGAVYLGVSAISMFYAPMPKVAYYEVIARIKYLVIFLFIFNYLNSVKRFDLLCRVLVIGLALQGMLCGYNYTTQTVQNPFAKYLGLGQADLLDDIEESNSMIWINDKVGQGKIRASGTVNYSNPNAQGQYHAMVLPFSLYLLVTARGRQARLFWSFAYILGLMGLILTFSRGALGAYLVACTMIILFATYRKLISLKILFILGVLTVASIPGIWIYMATRPDAFLDRFPLYTMAFWMIKQNPLLGIGTNNSFIAGYDAPDPSRVFFGEHFHNFFLTSMVEIGIIGTVFFTSVFIMAIVASIRSFTPNHDNIKVNWLSVLINGGLFGTGAHLFIDNLSGEINTTMAWILAAMGLALYRVRQPHTTSSLRPSRDLKNFTNRVEVNTES